MAERRVFAYFRQSDSGASCESLCCNSRVMIGIPRVRPA